MLSVFEWSVFVLWCDAFVLIVLSDEPSQNQGRGSPSNFIASRPKAALLFGRPQTS